jgi:hypothetical protein
MGEPNPWAEILTHEILLQKLDGTEDDFIERKPKGRSEEFLQVAVAFANSAPIGAPAILFAGADDVTREGQIELNRLEDAEKSICDTLKRIYPPIYKWCVHVHTLNGRGCIAVVIQGSENRPHFAGQAFIRVGPQVEEASAEQFEALIASRNDKVREIRRWVGETVSCRLTRGNRWRLGDWNATGSSKLGLCLIECTNWYVTLQKRGRNHGDEPTTGSFPLSRVEISFDHQLECLELEIDQ